MLKRKKAFSFLLMFCFIFISVGLSCHLIRSYLDFHTFAFESGEFNGDRLVNFGIAKASQCRGINYLDPFNRQDIVFYQFFPYWILGLISNLVGKNPWEVANVIQIFLPALFFVVIYNLSKLITGKRETSLLAVLLMFSFGSLEFFLTKTVNFTVYGDHAVILNFIRQTYGFYLDNYAVLFGYVGLYFLYKMIRQDKCDFKNSIVFIIFASIAYNVHLLPALLFIVLYIFIIFTKTIIDDYDNRSRYFLFLAIVAFVYVLLLYFYNFLLPMKVIELTAIILFMYFFFKSKNKTFYYIYIVSLIPLAIISISNLYYLFKINPLNPHYFDEVRTHTLFIPLNVLIISFLPFFILAYIAINKETDMKTKWYYRAMCFAMFVLVYNNYFGYNNHPYRFIPYVFPLLSIIAAKGFERLYVNREKWISTSGILIIFICITLLMGTYKNLASYKRYAFSTSKPVDRKVGVIVKDIESVRKTGGDPVFCMSPSLISADKLSPYTAAKFYYISSIGYDNKYLTNIQEMIKKEYFDEIIDFIEQNNLKIDYFVSNKKYNSYIPNFDTKYFVKYNDVYIYNVKKIRDDYGNKNFMNVK